MNSKESSKIYRLPMATLQKGLVMHCKLLGLRKSTSLALVLMMNSKDLLIAMLYFMAKIEQRGLQEVMDQDDITTMVVNTAEGLREIWDKRNNK